MSKLIATLVVLAAGYFVAMKLVPFVFVRSGRLLGFRMRLTPLMRKRVERFKRIRRGYYSFVALVVLFVTSLFLEVLVNHKPIYLRYQEATACPALRDLGNNVLFFWRPFADFDRSADFGIPGKQQLDYRMFTRCVEDPEGAIATLIEAKQKELQGLVRDFQDLRREIEELRADGQEPEQWELEELAGAEKVQKELESEMEELRQAQPVFGSGDANVLWPIYEYSAFETRLDLPAPAPFPPSLWRRARKEDGTIAEVGRWEVPLGTDPSGVDVIPQLLYGFRVSVGFALVVLACGYTIGIVVGALMGYFGGWIDIGVQRLIEVWGSIPFLFTIMIIVEITQPSFLLLATLLIVLSGWLGITYLIRGEFYREKARDYVHAAIGTGVSDAKVMLKHILPNSLVPVISTAPFAFVAYINALVSLDFLGFGLPPGTPSWGGMLRRAFDFLQTDPHLVLIPVAALAITLLLVVLIGEAVREAFDPKVFSRLR